MIEQVIKRINLDLPLEYLEIFSFMNGGEGFIGDNYCRLYPIEDLIPLNEAFSVKEFAPELFIFGSNVDGEAFAFNTTSNPFSIVEIPFIPMDMEWANLLGKTITEFFSNFSNGEEKNSPQVNKDLIGKEIHEIHPIAFGGDPLDPKNKALVPIKNYAEIVVFWNEVWHRIKQDVAK
jgi:hypothetical protein